MILPMKKVSVLVLDSEKSAALKTLRKLGLVHISEMQGTGTRLAQLKEQNDELERSMFALQERMKKGTAQQDSTTAAAIAAAQKVTALFDEQKACQAKITGDQNELERLKNWEGLDPAALHALAQKGVRLFPCEMPAAEYQALGQDITTLPVSRDKLMVRFLTVDPPEEGDPTAAYRVRLPQASTDAIRQEIGALQQQMTAIDGHLDGMTDQVDGMKRAIAALQKDIELETYLSGMTREALTEDPQQPVAVSHFSGYIPEEDLDKLKAAAREHAWGLLVDDPTEEDNVPTKLRNNKFVSLIYPLTDFLGTVPGYFEYDISGWFLGFIMVFFGIIFGDGGYGLLICGVAGALMLKDKKAGKAIPPMYWLIMLLGGATVLWGLVTCTWFGLTPDQLPGWLKALSIPLISNVNADRLWYPFWTNGQVGLTTAQNLQIFCFLLALFQLTVAHIKGMIRNRRSLKVLSDVGSILQLWGIFYVVLTLVVNGEVFGLTRVISGFPIGTVSLALVGVGFVLSFVFANYDGSIKDSILESLKNIISVLLGVVNLFSDIVSYIRLWAVGLAGAAISATVNEMAGPMLGNLVFVVFAVILLVFGHGLNMVLNLLSVVVHGVRLNTLEFSTHLDMSWSGHKFKPFEE